MSDSSDSEVYEGGYGGIGNLSQPRGNKRKRWWTAQVAGGVDAEDVSYTNLCPSSNLYFRLAKMS